MYGYDLDPRGGVRMRQPDKCVTVKWGADHAISTDSMRSHWYSPGARLEEALAQPEPGKELATARKPAGRREVLMLCAWLQKALSRLDSEDAAAELRLWDGAMIELIEQATVQCAERGRLIELARAQYLGYITKLEAQLASGHVSSAPGIGASGGSSSAESRNDELADELADIGSGLDPEALDAALQDVARRQGLGGSAARRGSRRGSAAVERQDSAISDTHETGHGSRRSCTRHGSCATQARSATLGGDDTESVGFGTLGTASLSMHDAQYGSQKRPNRRSSTDSSYANEQATQQLVGTLARRDTVQQQDRPDLLSRGTVWAPSLDRMTSQCSSGSGQMSSPKAHDRGLMRGGATGQSHAGLMQRHMSRAQLEVPGQGQPQQPRPLLSSPMRRGGCFASSAQSRRGSVLRPGGSHTCVSFSEQRQASGASAISSTPIEEDPPELIAQRSAVLAMTRGATFRKGSSHDDPTDTSKDDEKGGRLAARRFKVGTSAKGKEDEKKTQKCFADLMELPYVFRAQVGRAPHHVSPTVGTLSSPEPTAALSRAQVVNELVDKMSPDERLELLMAKFHSLTSNEKRTFVEGHYDHLMQHTDEVTLHKGMVDGFARLDLEQQGDVLEEMIATTPMTQQSSLMQSCMLGVGEDTEAPALAHMLAGVSTEVRLSAFAMISSMNEGGEMSDDERRETIRLLHAGISGGGGEDVGVQTELTFADIEQRIKDAESAAEHADVTYSAQWEERAASRRRNARKSEARREETKLASRSDFGIQYVGFFGKKAPPPENIGLSELLSTLASVLDDKMAVDEAARAGGKAVPTLAAYLCNSWAKKGVQGKKDLSSLLSAVTMQSVGHARIKLFGEAAGLVRKLEAAYDPSLEKCFAVIYGDGQKLRKQFTDPLGTPFYVPLMREAADAARISSGPLGGDNFSWGSVEEICEVSELPEHLLVSFREKCAQKSEELLRPDVPADDRRAVDSDALLNVLFTARRAMRRQQHTMLKDRFVRADADGNGVLSLAEFWVALQEILEIMEKQGTADGTINEWADRGRAEELFNEVLFEAEETDTSGEEITEISSESFVSVMLRLRLYDTDFAGYLERNPEQRASFSIY